MCSIKIRLNWGTFFRQICTEPLIMWIFWWVPISFINSLLIVIKYCVGKFMKSQYYNNVFPLVSFDNSNLWFSNLFSFNAAYVTIRIDKIKLPNILETLENTETWQPQIENRVRPQTRLIWFIRRRMKFEPIIWTKRYTTHQKYHTFTNQTKKKRKYRKWTRIIMTTGKSKLVTQASDCLTSYSKCIIPLHSAFHCKYNTNTCRI